MENYHAESKHKRFAYDLLVTKDGSTHAGAGKGNDDYCCFGKPIVAPGAGTVRAVENAIEDNIPGVMNVTLPLDNYVILDHGNDEFSFLAYLRRGSGQLQKGDQVPVGELLAEILMPAQAPAEFHGPTAEAMYRHQEKMRALAATADPRHYGLCHGDVDGGNMLYDQGHIWLLDFEPGCHSWRILDFFRPAHV